MPAIERHEDCILSGSKMQLYETMGNTYQHAIIVVACRDSSIFGSNNITHSLQRANDEIELRPESLRGSLKQPEELSICRCKIIVEFDMHADQHVAPTHGGRPQI